MHTPPLHVALAFNLKTEDTEEQAEHLDQEYIDEVQQALEAQGHQVSQVEVTGDAVDIFRRLGSIDPDLVFNLAEGEGDGWREALYPMVYEFLGLPYTFAGPGILGLGLDKRLTEEALSARGVDVPRGAFLTPDHPEIPDHVRYPLLIKPNFGGSSMGIHQESVVKTPAEAKDLIERMLDEYPAGLDVEEFIEGRELTIGFLAESREVLTHIVEYTFPDSEQNILDYETKQANGSHDAIRTQVPADLTPEEEHNVRNTAAKAFGAMRVRDACRVDLRLRDDGKVFVIEVNPLPGLRRISPLVVGARSMGLGYDEVIGMIVRSAARRYHMLGDVEETIREEATI